MKKHIFQTSFENLAFVIGVAYSNNMFPAHLKTRWIKFLQYYIPLISSLKDCFTKKEHEEIAQFVNEIDGFAKEFKEVGPALIQSAEEAAPKATWKAPILFDTWRWRKDDPTPW